MKVIIAAAGTGGHINPGIAIANKIMKEEKNSEILFVGTSRGIEKDLIPRAGYKLETIEAYGFSKKLNKDNIFTARPGKELLSCSIVGIFSLCAAVSTGPHIYPPVPITISGLNSFIIFSATLTDFTVFIIFFILSLFNFLLKP